ncbi:uncharacterized protein BT62DRAFT_936052 [Guyanagaster necrorhizus]|uniref:Uncharacterized protein n=1 Tax=Guyanagaster necrorhizus TaxID=856835 RepID=A0A9P7VM61_9AGAR|nr:uncharacterized protein BT62DRAFT_936052 [Guyanagaster necrorhizus MCA 3950]KAG7442496.1 hypothetical protein BT62DRAFT_936052 [Guyanagaster necrorhizus MCA 3950]
MKRSTIVSSLSSISSSVFSTFTRLTSSFAHRKSAKRNRKYAAASEDPHRPRGYTDTDPPPPPPPPPVNYLSQDLSAAEATCAHFPTSGNSSKKKLRTRGTATTTTKKQKQKQKQKPTFQIRDSRCLQEITDRLYVAFEEGAVPLDVPRCKAEWLKTPDGDKFTHIVKIMQGPGPGPRSDHYWDENTSTGVLELSLPPRDDPPYPYVHERQPLRAERKVFVNGRMSREREPGPGPGPTLAESKDKISGLSITQLTAARDFIYVALYYTKRRRVPGGNVLITVPQDCRADAISIMIVYLGYFSGSGIGKILRYLDRKEGINFVWRDVVSRYGLGALQVAVAI